MFSDRKDGKAGEVVSDKELISTINRVVKRELKRQCPTSYHLPENMKQKASSPAVSVKKRRVL